MAALTLKQEAFCQRYIETGNASEAYRQAYKSKAKAATQHRSAHELLLNPKVAARVAQLRKGLENAHKVTVNSLMLELEEARKLAKQVKSPASMVSATMGKAKLAGLDKDPDTGGDEAIPVKVEVTVSDARVTRAPA